ncbi:MAG: hypothetical protein JSV76_05650, partial [Candidatus Bathyarchaeota archaeon]
SEYGYLNWHGGISLKFNWSNSSLNIRYFERQRDYADAVFFDAKIRQLFARTNIFFSRQLTASFTGSWQRFRLPQLLINEPEAETTRLLEQQESARKAHVDNLYEFGIGLQWIGRILIQPNYAFQRNKSNSPAYSFHNHQVSILAASPLYWEMTMQLYGRLQLRQYDSPITPSFHPPDEDNTEEARNVIIFSLTRDILKNCSLDARYSLSQSNIPSSSTRYTKQSYSVTISYSF